MRLRSPIGLALLVLGTTLVSVYCRQTLAAQSSMLALVGAKVYVSPVDPPISNAVVLLRDGKVAAVDKAEDAQIPARAEKLDCTGLVITAGFQNSHVHFTDVKWNNAAKQPASNLSQQLEAMLTRWGDTTVVDLGSDLANTNALRARINSAEISGPRILTAGGGIYPPLATPYYLRDTVPSQILQFMAEVEEPATPEEVVRLVAYQIANGADVINLFTDSLIGPTQVQLMPDVIARAAVSEAHRHGRLVFAHPSSVEGLKIAIRGGADVLARTTSRDEPWDRALILQLLARHMSLIPTLELWEYDMARAGTPAARRTSLATEGAEELGAYKRAGGLVLFGTDAGYMTDYDPSEEYVLMSRGGLTPMQILAALTTAPAERLGESRRRGRIAPGMDADLVVLDGDPVSNVRALAKVRYTIRAGRVIYAKPK